MARWAGGWSALALALLCIPASNAQTSAGRTPIPLEALIREPALSQVQLSPDGAHMAAITSADGVERSISIWGTETLNVTPTRFGVSGASARARVRFEGISWVSNDRLLVLMSQPVTVGSGDESRTYTYLARFVNLDGSRWVEPLASGGARSEIEQFVEKFLNVELIDQLPNDDRHILMMQASLDEGRAVYRVDVVNGSGERVMRLGEDESITPIVDSTGAARVKQFADFRNNAWVTGYSIYDTASSSWREQPALTSPVSARRNLNVIAFDPENDDMLIVLDNDGQNYTYARGYSISQRNFVETMFQDPRHDISDVIIERVDGRPTRVIGFRYLADDERPFWADPAYQAMYDGVAAQLPGRIISIGMRHGRYRIVAAQSSVHPPTFYLLTDDRQLAALGESYPGIASDQLAPTQLVSYAARDGLTIPAYLTLPYGWQRGDPPLPVIIQPHGGPWAHNDASWGGGDIPVTQYFASRGFAVLQPQFRGSTGFGDQLWRAGDNQWGMAMQDDKDDGLAWLVQQGIGDPQRALIYGFSYGGFAAAAATVRPNSPYRCAISGDGVSSLQRIGTLWRENRIQRQAQGVTVGGMDPLEHASDANIPILIYHGDRDQTAPIWHSERFAAALRANNKPVQYEVIPDMPHGAITTAMRRREFEIVENFIKGQCGIPY